MPIDLAEVDWLYVILLAVFVAVSTFLGGLLSFRRRGAGAILSALFFTAIFVFWTYYPHRVPFLPRTLNKVQDATVKPVPAPAPAPATSQRPSNPVRDITPPKNPVTDVTPPAAPAR
jgi:hypothetical protein